MLVPRSGPEYTRFSGDRRRASLGDDGGDSDTLLRKEAQLTLSQMLFDGFETRSEVERQTARVSSAAYRVQETAEFIALDAVEAHLEVLRYQEIVKLSDDEPDAARALSRPGPRSGAWRPRRQRRRRADLGAHRPGAGASIASSRGSLADAIATYEQIVGERAGRPRRSSHRRWPRWPAGAEDAALQASVTSPTVLIAASDVDVAEAELRGTRANYLPRSGRRAVRLGRRRRQRGPGRERRRLGAAGHALQPVSRRRRHRPRARGIPARQPVPRRAAAGPSHAPRRRRGSSFNALETARARTVALRARPRRSGAPATPMRASSSSACATCWTCSTPRTSCSPRGSALTTAEFTDRFAVYRNLAVVGTLLDTLEITRPREVISIYRAPERHPDPGRRARQEPRSSSSRGPSRGRCAARRRASRRSTRWTPPMRCAEPPAALTVPLPSLA